jgi:simple sugar transport system ATP-binding protein
MTAAREAVRPKTGRVEMRDIVKRFPGVLANSGVCFDVVPGEVHALLGENGAGKSTLMRQLYGMYRPDSGQIIVDGTVRNFRSPADAIAAGIGMIHQHFMLVPTMTVAQNVALGLPSGRGPFTDTKGVSKEVTRLGNEYGLKVDPDAFVWQLSVGEQQRVEIIKALYRGAGLVILDEPTAVLTPQEVEDLFTTFRTMLTEGHSLIFISHKLYEVKAISDRVTVLRDGQVVGSGRTCDLSQQDLVHMMVGREVKDPDPRPHTPGPELVKMQGLKAMGDRGLEALRGIDLSIRSGEILGLAGVSGNGQKELAECLAGMRKLSSGKLLVEGHDMTNATVNERFDRGMAFIPEERMRDGAIREFTVEENVFLHDHMSKRFRRWIFLSFDRMREHALSLVELFSVKTPSLEVPIKNLSGGNIQKLIMARELSRDPFFLVAAQPTRGVDIGASEYIHDSLLAQREKGMAILLISEDLDELRGLSDRIAVMYEGGIIGIVDRGSSTVEELGFMMAGVTLEQMRKDGASTGKACP